MATVKFSELLDAFDFASTGDAGENTACVCRETGRIYLISSELGPLDEDAPEDLEVSEQYAQVPHKNDLNLGRQLALRFVDEHLPNRYDEARAYFSRKGAYSKFKRMLDDEGALEKWYDFEAAETREALRDWCDLEGIAIDEGTAGSGTSAFDQAKAEAFASEWIAAWNSHDLERILAHYDDDFEFSSPFIIDIAGEASGVLHGKSAVRAYWREALERNPELRFELENVFWGVRTLVIQYRRHDGRLAAEWFEIGDQSKITRSAAQYGPLP